MPKTTNTCASCRHWRELESWSRAEAGTGECRRSIERDAKARCGYADYPIVTTADFACNQFAPKAEG